MDEIDTEALLYVLEDVPGRLAPYVPTPHWLRETIARLLRELKDTGAPDVVYEPGAGAGEAGETIEEVAKPRYYIGVEIDASLARRARTRIQLGDIVVADLRRPPLRDRPYLIYSYLLPKPLAYVLEWSPKGSVVVSLEYEAENVPGDVRVEKHRIEAVFTTHRIIVYRI